MFLRPDGTRISEDVMITTTHCHVHWVSVDFSKFGGRVPLCGSLRLMRIMAEQIRSGLASVGDKPLHHEKPTCLSLPVVGDRDLPVVQVLESAAAIAD